VSDIEVEAHEIGGARDIPAQQIAARVKNLEPLGEDMMLLHLQTPRTRRLQFLAGQSVRLEVGNGTEADYPISSCPCDERNLQFHIRRAAGDRFTDYVFRKLKGGDIVSLAGPKGEFTLNEESPRPLILLACGTGFAPIKGLIEHAMARDTAESMHLYWVAGADGHYLNNLCRAWADALDNFHYRPLVAGPKGFVPALQQIAGEHPDLAAFDVYAAGPAPFLTAAGKFLRDRRFPQDQLVTERLER